jgi:hypothetical protein
VSTVIIICRKIKKPRPPKGPKTRRDNEEHPSLDYATGETEWINCGARHVCLSAPTSSRLDDCVPKILNHPITTQTGFQVDCPGRRVDSWTVKKACSGTLVPVAIPPGITFCWLESLGIQGVVMGIEFASVGPAKSARSEIEVHLIVRFWFNPCSRLLWDEPIILWVGVRDFGMSPGLSPGCPAAGASAFTIKPDSVEYSQTLLL